MSYIQFVVLTAEVGVCILAIELCIPMHMGFPKLCKAFSVTLKLFLFQVIF